MINSSINGITLSLNTLLICSFQIGKGKNSVFMKAVYGETVIIQTSNDKKNNQKRFIYYNYVKV